MKKVNNKIVISEDIYEIWFCVFVKMFSYVFYRRVRQSLVV
jgi:hypothetical protein